jgi:hypothetical protein
VCGDERVEGSYGEVDDAGMRLCMCGVNMGHVRKRKV